MDSLELISRFKSLSSRELRILIRATESGIERADVAAQLGMTRGNVASALASIRRKLAVPRYEDLGDFVARMPELAAVAAEAADGAGERVAVVPDQERRVQDLLRATINELEAVAVRAERRAKALVSLPGTDEASAQRDQEATALNGVADALRRTLLDVLTIARASGRSD